MNNNYRRNALGRLQRIADAMRDGEWVTAKELAEKEETCTKTIYRYIDFLRDQLGWNIEGGAPGLRLVKRGRHLL